MNKAVPLLFLILSVLSFPQETNRNYEKQNAFSGTLFLGGDAGISLGATDYAEIRIAGNGRVYLEYFFPTTNPGIFGIRAFLFGGYVDGRDVTKYPQIFHTQMGRFGIGASYNYAIMNAVFPFIYVGLDYGYNTPFDDSSNSLHYTANTGVYDKHYVNYLGEAGMRIILTNSLTFNASVTAHFSRNDYLDNFIGGDYKDFFYTVQAGLSISLFGFDSDGDGVPNSDDACPKTPAGVTVDEFGCPVDSDRDNVPDYQDRCPNTPKGVAVDKGGCPIDSDGDNVPDAFDRCPNTAKGVSVNEFGCPDSDGDGVADDRDRCPETPFGAPVNENGCPRDSDGDGIPNYLDKCPNTPPGRRVNADGCENVDTVVTKIILGGDTNFEPNKSSLLNNAYPTLNKLATTMINNPSVMWVIEGHTDSKGSEESNMILSRARAQAVADYLISNGVNPLSLRIVPLGESKPIASNETVEGRAMNRRVEIKSVEGNK